MNWLWEFDVQLFKLIHVGLHRDWLDPIMLVITNTGFWYQLIPLFAALVYSRTRKIAAVVAGSYVSAGLPRLIIEELVKRQRPSNFSFSHPLEQIYGDSSFPSGHTTTSFAIAFGLWFALCDSEYAWIGKVALAWASLVGFSRIYVGVHYPTDVLAGVLLAAIFAYLFCSWCRSKGWIGESAASELDAGLPSDE